MLLWIFRDVFRFRERIVYIVGKVWEEFGRAKAKVGLVGELGTVELASSCPPSEAAA